MANDDQQAVERLQQVYAKMKEEVGRVIVGQDEVVEQTLMAIFCRGHALLVGVPGLAKTLLISTLSEALELSFKRIQFTPDLMPADITGTDVLEVNPETGHRGFRFVHGPLFANMVLADEINRTPPKTQAALLEAMQEHHVTVGEHTLDLPKPFFVLATQNPIEQEGTYPLPEAQLDRFLFNIIVDYPSADDEREIIRRVTSPSDTKVTPSLNAEEIIRLQAVVKRVPVGDHVIDFAAKLARATRPKSDEAPDFVKEMVGWGAGPRAGISLISAAKAHAVLRGRFHATTADVVAVAKPVLRHRIITTFSAEAAGITSDEIVQRLVETLAPKSDIVL
jgi:MoxR-like ATPase